MTKGTYVDGFVLVVPKNKISDYKKMAQSGLEMWKRHGALDYKECMIDDAKPKGITFPFTKMVKAKKNETVWFSYIVFKSRQHRDAVNKKVMSDPAMNDPKWKDAPMPMDMKRMAYGGFKVVVS
jgi:alkaline phosphatase